jgi:DNA-binding MarR family transcriptional regulator
MSRGKLAARRATDTTDDDYPSPITTSTDMQRKLLLNLLSAVYWFDDAVQDNLEAQGYGRATRAISFILLNVALGESRAVSIAKNLGISRQAVSQMLLGLRDRGMLDIQQDPSDGRSQIIKFAPKFAKQAAACKDILGRLEAELGRRIGGENLKALRRALGEDWGAPPVFTSAAARNNGAKSTASRSQSARTRKSSGASVNRKLSVAANGTQRLP